MILTQHIVDTGLYSTHQTVYTTVVFNTQFKVSVCWICYTIHLFISISVIKINLKLFPNN